MRWNTLKDDACPVARGLSVVGDRWTMLVLRECFFGSRRFEQFQKRLGITRHVLANRLRKLELAGLLERKAYQDRPVRHEYHLTQAGLAFHPVLILLGKWANTHVPKDGRSSLRIISRETGKPIRPVLIDENTGEPIAFDGVRWPNI